jgi:hypothetical protein
MASGDSMFSGGGYVGPVGCTRAKDPGGGTPVEPFLIHSFADGAAQDLLIVRHLSPRYSGGGVKLLLRWRSTATSGAVVWRAKFRLLPDGAKYVGGWLNGLPHGNGSLTFASGERFRGRGDEPVFDIEEQVVKGLFRGLRLG